MVVLPKILHSHFERIFFFPRVVGADQDFRTLGLGLPALSSLEAAAAL
jgi:hypothetical protein